MTEEEYYHRKKYMAVVELIDGDRFDEVYRALEEFFKISALEHGDIFCARCGALVIREYWGNQLNTLKESQHGAAYCSSSCRLRFGGERSEPEPKSEYERILKKHGTYNRYEKHREMNKSGNQRV